MTKRALLPSTPKSSMLRLSPQGDNFVNGKLGQAIINP